MMHSTSIGFYLSYPFPSYELLNMLPVASEILLGLLGADEVEEGGVVL